MRTTFKQFLFEGGAATSKFNVERATKDDIEKALEIVARTLNLPDVKERILGSVHLTLAGKKQDSGDIDIVISNDEIDPAEADAKMLKLTNNEGGLNKGTKIGSYAVDIGEKKVQVDLMFVNNKDWAKFIFHSQHGDGSNYPGAVRNILLMAVTRNTHERGKDFLIKKDDAVIARASRALKLDTGLERLFKLAKKDKEGNHNPKNMEKVDPATLKDAVHRLAGFEVKFSPDADIMNDPDTVAKWLFGPNTTAADIMTAEQVCALIKKHRHASLIIHDAKEALKGADLPIPNEL